MILYQSSDLFLNITSPKQLEDDLNLVYCGTYIYRMVLKVIKFDNVLEQHTKFFEKTINLIR